MEPGNPVFMWISGLLQYYVEGHHEGIVTADRFDQVQVEILRRKGLLAGFFWIPISRS